MENNFTIRDKILEDYNEALQIFDDVIKSHLRKRFENPSNTSLGRRIDINTPEYGRRIGYVQSNTEGSLRIKAVRLTSTSVLDSMIHPARSYISSIIFDSSSIIKVKENYAYNHMLTDNIKFTVIDGTSVSLTFIEQDDNIFPFLLKDWTDEHFCYLRMVVE